MEKNFEHIIYSDNCSVISQIRAIKQGKSIIYSHEKGRGVLIVENFEEARLLKQILMDMGIKIKGSKAHSVVDGKIVIHFHKFIPKPFQEYYDGTMSIDEVIDTIYNSKLEARFKGTVVKVNVVRRSYDGGGSYSYFLEEKVTKVIDGELYEYICKDLKKHIRKQHIKDVIQGDMVDNLRFGSVIDGLPYISYVTDTEFSELGYGKGRHHRYGHIRDSRFLVMEEDLHRYRFKDK